MGLSFLSTGAGLVLFIFQECLKFDGSQLASPFFLLVPVFLSLSVPLILGGAARMICGPSDVMDHRVRAASIRVAILLILICLSIYLLALVVSAKVATRFLPLLILAGVFAIVWILGRTLIAPDYWLVRTSRESLVRPPVVSDLRNSESLVSNTSRYTDSSRDNGNLKSVSSRRERT
jgi:hypothetical protein